MSEEDYAVKAAKEWLTNSDKLVPERACDCFSCRSDRKYNTAQVEGLAAVIRRHAAPEMLRPVSNVFKTIEEVREKLGLRRMGIVEGRRVSL